MEVIKHCVGCSERTVHEIIGDLSICLRCGLEKTEEKEDE